MRLKVKEIQDLAEAKRYWDLLVDSESWYQQWDVRMVMHDVFGESRELLFLVAFEEEVPVGLLPLQYNLEKDRWECWGGGFIEDNQFFVVRPEEVLIRKLYESIPKPFYLDNYLRRNGLKAEESDVKYVFSLAGISGLDELLVGQSKNIKRDLRNVMAIDGLHVVKGKADDLEILFRLNIQRFGEDSIFADVFWKEVFRRFVSLDYDWQILKFLFKDKTVGVSVGTFYKNVYIYHNSGVDVGAVPNLGKLVIHKNFELAIEMEAKMLDAGTEDLGWKERWGLERVQLWKFVCE